MNRRASSLMKDIFVLLQSREDKPCFMHKNVTLTSKTFYVNTRQVGNVSVDDVTSVRVPGTLPVSVLTIEHNLNCGVSDEEMQIPPLALAVDMMPG